MPNPIDLTNQRFGRLVAKYYTTHKNKSGRSVRLWYCECDCGGHTFTSADRLRSGKTQSCGCLNAEKTQAARKKNLTGQRFGKLIAIKTVGQDNRHNFIWECKCDCGNTTYALTQKLLNGSKISCGCIHSKGENKIEYILKSIGLSYQKQYTFEDCINPLTNRKLKFDFYISDFNTCIEYDGEQHFFYRDTSDWNTKENFEKTVYRDNIKNLYCQNKNIGLIRIPYTEYENITEKYILDYLLQKGEG